jgi:RNA-directed DNA polymerase
VRHDRRGQICGPRAVVRYADDWVVFCESKEDAEQVIATLRTWLGQRGLTFSDEKTRIVHLSDGFDFLGFSVRHYPARGSSRTGQKLLITPSRAAVHKLRDRIRSIWWKHRGAPVVALLQDLNPLIRGWANYFRIGVTSATFAALDSWMFTRASRYAKFRHPKKAWTWRQHRYWGKLNPHRDDRWVFGDPHTGAYLLKFGWFPVHRHVLVRGTASPDDPQLRTYWRQRVGAQATARTAHVQKLARRQAQVCPVCNETLFNDEEVQAHHIQPRRHGGSDDESNLLLAHLYCHQQIHASEAQAPAAHEPPEPRRRWLRKWLA